MLCTFLLHLFIKQVRSMCSPHANILLGSRNPKLKSNSVFSSWNLTLSGSGDMVSVYMRKCNFDKCCKGEVYGALRAVKKMLDLDRPVKASFLEALTFKAVVDRMGELKWVLKSISSKNRAWHAGPVERRLRCSWGLK